MRVAAKSGARFVALLGIVAQATTFVALRAIIPISRATRSAWGLCRGSLTAGSAIDEPGREPFIRSAATMPALLYMLRRRASDRAILASAAPRLLAAVPATRTLALTLSAAALREYLLRDFVRVGLEAGDDFAPDCALDQALDIAQEGMLVDAHQ